MRDTTVFVVEQSPRYREWIVEAVESHAGMRIAGQSTDGLSAREAILRTKPDVATVAVRLPGLGGIELVRAIVAAGVRTRMLVIGSPLGAATVSDALDAQAAGYVWKGQGQDVIATAIAAVARGELFLGPRVQSDLFEDARMRANGGQLELTARETEVLALVAEGCSTQAIATSLELAVPTVKTHISRTYAKLGVSDRAAAVAKAMRHGLLA